MTSVNKLELRRQLRAARRNLTERAQRQHSQSAIRHLLTHLKFICARHIALYWPADGELDLTDICYLNKDWYLPIVSEAVRPFEPTRLLFQKFEGTGQMILNKFGIPEPGYNPARLISILNLDIILLPLVGFDKQGNRLGMGGGYYDRSLARIGQNTSWRKPLLVGVAHSIQEREALERENWDIPLDAIVTERGITSVSGRF